MARALALTAGALLLLGAAGAWAATPTARYDVRFDSAWSAQSHPQDFPSTAHFSGPIGGTHDAGVSFWEEGTLASPGIEKMAEQGRQSPLDEEIGAAITAGSAGEIIRGTDIDSPGDAVTMSFTATQEFPLVTLVTMVAPSPDWFLGVKGLSLMEGGDWLQRKVVQLYAWDAGTDSGVTFKSPNQDTFPPVPVHRITTGPLGNGEPLGTFTFTRTDTVPPPPLELLGGRFAVTVTWETRNGTRGFGQPETLTEDSGYFWFFDQENLELVVKMVDACGGTFDRFWFFAAGLTDVEVEIRVEDTEHGVAKTYTNPQGTAFQPLQDTGAFNTCP